MADVTNAVLIIIFTILLSLFTELVNFILVYRLPEYKKNVADIEKENEALELLQNKLSSASLTQRDKVKKKKYIYIYIHIMYCRNKYNIMLYI